MIDKSPVAAYHPTTGELVGPYRATLTDERFTLSTKAGDVMVDEAVIEHQIAMRQFFVTTDTGRWRVRDLCGCSQRMAAMKVEWRNA